MGSRAGLGMGKHGGGPPVQKCEAAKLTASGDKTKCLLKAEANSVRSGQPPNTTQCVKAFTAAFALAEQRAGPGVCPTEGDVDVIEDFIDTCVTAVADALSGGLPPSPCQQFSATGQTTFYYRGDDGDIQAGATLSYTDTGNGTIIDNNTGLEWEKQSGDGTIHDVDNTYPWVAAFTEHVASLNRVSFAGHTDWRLPNVKELQSIVNYENFNPSVSAVFHTNCLGATVLTGSCTAASSYWSSTTFAFAPSGAWSVSFIVGSVVGTVTKDVPLRVRAVRGGL